MRKLGLLAAAMVFGASVFFGLSGRWPWHRLSSPAVPPTALPPPPLPYTETQDTLHGGETLSDLFARHNITFDFQRLNRGLLLNPRRVRAGLVFNFRQPLGDSAPNHISVRTSPEQRVVFTRISDGWEANAEPIRWQTEETRIEGVINNSLYEALDAGVAEEQLDSGNRQRLAWDLADVYAWQVDFTRDIQPGDSFRVVFERRVSQDGEVRVGNVLASDLTMSGKRLSAFRFGGVSGGSPLY
jgi:hypothetical protein